MSDDGTSDATFTAELRSILAAHPDASSDPRTLFGGTSDDFWYWLNTRGTAANASVGSLLPALPPEVIQVRFTGRIGDETLREGFDIYRLFKQRYEHHNGSVSACEAVLDFGCGWGRVIRFFLKDVAGPTLYGIDVLDLAIEACKATNSWSTFETTAAMPPTRFAPNSFNFIYCYSVFSHLAEPAHLAWLREFERILKPGGIFIGTTRSREFIEYTAWVRALDPKPEWAVTSSTALAFEDTERWLNDFDRGEFCFTPTGGGAGLDRSFYGETCIPEGYVRRHWANLFEVLEYIADPTQCEQNVMVVRKRGK